MKTEVTSISILRASLLAAALYGVLGLIFWPFLLATLLVSRMSGSGSGPEVFGMALMLFLPVLYAVAGFVFTALLCLAYNLLARVMGGFEVTLRTIAAPVVPETGVAAAPAGVATP